MNTKFLLSMLQNNQKALAISSILSTNAITEKYGLSLSPADANALILIREESLQKTGRVEFGASIVDKLIFTFCDSPYLTQSNYTETLHDLIDLFAYFKNETCDALDDDTLIELMKDTFDHVCQGSLELLGMKDLETMARKLREGDSDFKTVRDPHHWYEWEEWND